MFTTREASAARIAFVCTYFTRRTVRLATDAVAQILGNQKIYGLFGLYAAAWKSSGLLDGDGDPVHLTPAARALVEKAYLPRLERASGRGAKVFVDRLRAPEYVLDTDGRDLPLLECVAQILKARPLLRIGRR